MAEELLKETIEKEKLYFSSLSILPFPSILLLNKPHFILGITEKSRLKKSLSSPRNWKNFPQGEFQLFVFL